MFYKKWDDISIINHGALGSNPALSTMYFLGVHLQDSTGEPRFWARASFQINLIFLRINN